MRETISKRLDIAALDERLFYAQKSMRKGKMMIKKKRLEHRKRGE
jgi:hypothetical protein